MITLTRLSGSVFVLNSDLIERIDSTPDSVITLIDGKKYVVCESLDQIIDAVRAYRSEVVVFGSQLAENPRAHAGSSAAAVAHAAGHERPTLVPVSEPRGEG